MVVRYLCKLLLQSHHWLWYALTALLLTALGSCINFFYFVTEGSAVTVLINLTVIFLSGVLGGWRTALISLILTISCIWLHQVYSVDSIYPDNYTLSEVVLFCMVGLLIVTVFHYLQKLLNSVTQSEEKFRRIIDKSAEGLLLCNADGQIIYSCAAAGRMLSLDAPDLLERSFFDFVAPEDNKNFRFQFLRLQVQQGNSSKIVQVRIKNKDGAVTWAECCLNNLLNDDLVKAVIIHVRNITERMNAQKQQEDFVHMAAHELKNPITAIKGYLQLLKMQLKKEDNGKYLNVQSRLEFQVGKLLGLIDDMLNVTHIKAGALQYHFEECDLRECVTEIVEAIGTTTSSHQLRLTLPDQPVKLTIDRTRIGQVITNLVNNAIKYSPDGASVEIDLNTVDGRALCHVCDHGIGIPADKQKRIFDRFYRVDTLPPGKFDGLGLGLFISAEIVARHHGKMGVESKENEGSDFWFSLPC
ncbi:PAS domain-containing sensor histidine kinase [Mucilaginibacter sp. HD30]